MYLNMHIELALRGNGARENVCIIMITTSPIDPHAVLRRSLICHGTGIMGSACREYDGEQKCSAFN